ncbi:hypothetical protein FDA94_28795 [Herbidospora galbida]|uniref:Uncharacterized protein n=1 Tax=Herbidospora galbida TaxID=2575442 RepID=A0A4U3M7W1_9ACTN|nr:hypothetical protein [Herbidospora galbida]TKK84630.1 hypothetical protein FDA94_28795 [Herbidospora galbida]
MGTAILVKRKPVRINYSVNTTVYERAIELAATMNLTVPQVLTHLIPQVLARPEPQWRPTLAVLRMHGPQNRQEFANVPEDLLKDGEENFLPGAETPLERGRLAAMVLNYYVAGVITLNVKVELNEP